MFVVLRASFVSAAHDKDRVFGELLLDLLPVAFKGGLGDGVIRIVGGRRLLFLATPAHDFDRVFGVFSQAVVWRSTLLSGFGDGDTGVVIFSMSASVNPAHDFDLVFGVLSRDVLPSSLVDGF